jgi:hypothetical protein
MSYDDDDLNFDEPQDDYSIREEMEVELERQNEEWESEQFALQDEDEYDLEDEFDVPF